MVLRRDNEIIKPTFFQINLPRNLINFEIINMAEFSFYYANRQCIFIKNDNEKKSIVVNDTFYIPNKKELYDFIENYSQGSFKYNIKVNKILTGRKYCFLKRKNSTILLYNIKSDNFNYFVASAKSLHIN